MPASLSHPVDMIALGAARAIEDEFAKGHAGGATQRQAAVQVIVIEAIKQAFDLATSGLATVQTQIAGER
jgi:hypothetical protein